LKNRGDTLIRWEDATDVFSRAAVDRFSDVLTACLHGGTKRLGAKEHPIRPTDAMYVSDVMPKYSDATAARTTA
jgi:hypothetical protein